MLCQQVYALPQSLAVVQVGDSRTSVAPLGSSVRGRVSGLGDWLYLLFHIKSPLAVVNAELFSQPADGAAVRDFPASLLLLL